ncbi:MAG: DUF255 domain-containing protein [Dehalococcoidia bacterium]
MNTQPDSSTDKGISWQTWNESTFKMAQLRDKPILLMITAEWCYWCHVMLEDTYLDQAVVSHVNDNYIPVLVDNDQRPELNFRYNVGGWPTTAILTPHGGMLAGATYLTPDQLFSMLSEVTDAYNQDKPGLYDRSRELFLQQQQRAARVGLSQVSTEVEPRIIDRNLIESIARMSIGTYDPLYGGFGYEPKFPNAPVISLMIYLFQQTQEPFYELIIRKTLDALTTSSMTDKDEGGVFRYTKTRDWNDPQYEKLLDDNTALSRSFLSAGLLLGDQKYLQAYQSITAFIHRDLYLKQSKSYRGSIGADSSYFGMTSLAKTHSVGPSADSWSYISSTAKQASLIIKAYNNGIELPLDSEELIMMLEVLYTKVSSEMSSHSYNETADGEPTNLLVDVASVLEVLASAINTSILPYAPWEDRLHELANRMMSEYYDERRGAFFDIQLQQRQPGYMAIREKPLPDNIIAIRALIKYQETVSSTQYADAIRISLISFLDVYQEYGEHSADFALLASEYLDIIQQDSISA